MSEAFARYGKKEEVYGHQTLFREMGYYVLRLDYYQEAMKIFDEALKNSPDNIRALIGRSRARSRSCYYQGAIEDISRALKLDPNNIEVLAEKALNTYLSCEFEDGLVQNTRLLPIRQKPNYFSLGIMSCSNAIQTSIGEFAGRPLRDHFLVIRDLAWNKIDKTARDETEKLKRKKSIRPFFKDKNIEVPSHYRRKNLNIKDSLHSHHSEKNIIPPFSGHFPFKPLQKYSSNIKNFMAEKYLESMYLDKNFLKKLQTEPAVCCPNQKGSEKLKTLAKTCYKMVSYKQEVLRTRRPFYHIKNIEGTSTLNLKTRLAQELYIRQQTTKNEAEAMFNKLKQLCKQNKFQAMLNQAAKLRTFCEAKPKRLLPDRNNYFENISKIIRKGYYNIYRINQNQIIWDQTKRVAFTFGLPISREPSADSVIKETTNILIDNKKEMQILEERLKDPALSNDEICLCYHDLCKYGIDLKQYEMARIYAKQCIQEANRTNNLEWIFVTTMLLIKLNIQVGNKNDAWNQLKMAMDIAKKLKNNNLIEYLEICAEVLSTTDFEGTSAHTVLKERQEKIIRLMGNTSIKNEFSHLFQKMSSMPISRRMAVIPGIRSTDGADKASISTKTRSIGAKDSPVNSINTEMSGRGFMNLIKYHIDD